MKIRKWRDRERKVVHAFDVSQDCQRSNVKTLCGLDVMVTFHGAYGNNRLPLAFVPKDTKPSPDLPKSKVPITCFVCLAASFG